MFENNNPGKVAVVMGGYSAEREISLLSGEAIYQGLIEAKVDAHKLVLDRDLIGPILKGNYDRVFVALHGRGGEDGVIQGALTAASIPYTGSGIMASALAMDKQRTKQLWNGINLPTPASIYLEAEVELNKLDAEQILADIGPVVFIKPALEGSSVGMSKASNVDELIKAVKIAKTYQCSVLVERWIDGEEYTVAIVDDQALPSIRLQTPRDFYDYEAKYQSQSTEYFCPSGLNDAEEEEIAQLSLQAYRSLGCEGWGRVDLMRGKSGEWFLLEVNTVPGMTMKSLVPMAARAAGLTFSELVVKILHLTLKIKQG